MIDAKEAVRLAGYGGAIQQINNALAIMKEAKREGERRGWDDMTIWLFSLQDIYNAGRIDGIRQERQRRKTRR